MTKRRKPIATEKEVREEEARLKKLRLITSLATHLILQGEMSLEEAEKFLECTRNAALTLFPGKEEVYDLIYTPRFRRLVAEIYRMS